MSANFTDKNGRQSKGSSFTTNFWRCLLTPMLTEIFLVAGLCLKWIWAARF